MQNTASVHPHTLFVVDDTRYSAISSMQRLFPGSWNHLHPSVLGSGRSVRIFQGAVIGIKTCEAGIYTVGLKKTLKPGRGAFNYPWCFYITVQY
jgi:hypothetical protein